MYIRVNYRMGSLDPKSEEEIREKISELLYDDYIKLNKMISVFDELEDIWILHLDFLGSVLKEYIERVFDGKDENVTLINDNYLKAGWYSITEVEGIKVFKVNNRIPDVNSDIFHNGNTLVNTLKEIGNFAPTMSLFDGKRCIIDLDVKGLKLPHYASDNGAEHLVANDLYGECIILNIGLRDTIHAMDLWSNHIIETKLQKCINLINEVEDVNPDIDSFEEEYGEEEYENDED